MKKCPSCAKSLVELSAGSVLIDKCSPGCGGIWFDSNEIKSLDDGDEPLGDGILDASSILNGIEEDKLKNCPCCPDETLIRRDYDFISRVEIDQCLKCNGIWLDNGELTKIRNQYKTEADRYRAGDAMLAESLNTIREHNKLESILRAQQIEDEKNVKTSLPEYLLGIFDQLLTGDQ